MMTNLIFKACAILMGLGLGLQSAEGTSSKRLPQLQESHEHLWQTKNIAAVEVSPDNKHVFVFYYTPQVASSEQGEVSNWIPTFFIRKNYKTSPASEGKTISTYEASSPSWMPDSKGVSYLAHEDKTCSLWTLLFPDFEPQKIFETEGTILGYQWSPNGKKLAFLADTKTSQDVLKIVHDGNRKSMTKLYILDVNDQLVVSN